MTIQKARTEIDLDLNLHVNIHLTPVATVDPNTLLESAKLTKRSVTSVAKKDILDLFVIPDLSLPQGLAGLHCKAMGGQSHNNNTNHDIVLMKLMTIQIFNLNVTLLTLSQRNIVMCLNISCLMKSQA